MHLLEKDIEQYGLISVTPQGDEFKDNPHELIIAEDRTFVEGDDDDDDAIAIGGTKGGAAGGGGGDQVLLSMLKNLRKDLAKKLSLPSWVIFSDPSLEDMSILYPITIDELKNCQGVGDGKAVKYGTEFLKLIDKYVTENEIERPNDIVIKSVANKSANKVFIIQSIDRKVPLDEIAERKNMDFFDLLDEIETIVNSGTKINLDYFIKQVVDEDTIDDIFDYFKNDAESDSIQEALDELGGEFEEEEIRLVRLKFICEVAN
jgi:ATP-dependent DNA helicase RecQ